MFVTRCQSCGTVVAVPLVPPNSLLTSYKGDFPCIDMNCDGHAEIVDEKALVTAEKEKIATLAADIYYRLLMEPKTNASFQKVASLLCTKRVISVDGTESNDGQRTIIHALKLEDGIVLRFAISSHGACVWRVEDPNAKNDRVPAQADPSDGTANRAQAGRSTEELEGTSDGASDERPS